jgi:hypothetical protein
MNREQFGRTVRGALSGAALFGGVALIQAWRSEAPFPRVLQPILFFAVLGLTLGGLAGPLIGQAIANRRQARGGSG